MDREEETLPGSIHSIPLQRREHPRVPSFSDTLGILGQGGGADPLRQMLPLDAEEGDTQVFGPSNNNINVLINPFQQHGTLDVRYIPSFSSQ